MTMATLGGRRKLGKYRIERKLGEGGFASVFRAYDEVEGSRVALKVPHPHLVTREALEQFRKEVRVNAQLDHANILPLKYAGFIDDQFVVVYPLGVETLDERLKRRVALDRGLAWAGQMLAAVAYAHRRRIMHCDLKPDNFILFDDGRLRLADFGLARITARTMTASGSGTVGYMAPEQALGRPSLRSDVFSLGLILYRLFAGVLPQWPFEWPPPGIRRLRAKLHEDFESLLARSLAVDQRQRFADATRMETAFRRLRPKAGKHLARRRRKAAGTTAASRWKELRFQEFQARYRATLPTGGGCRRCGGPLSEVMQNCPWCGTPRKRWDDSSTFPARCPRCRRGRKLDWRYCPWCWGRGFRAVAGRAYSDRRYTGRCSNSDCADRRLMPFMRYCPSCHRKTARPWPLPGSRAKCPRCNWGVTREFWTYCPWCGEHLGV